MPAPPEIEVYPDAKALAAVAARHVADALRTAIAARGRAALCLSGGSTPAPTYRCLATLGLDWSAIHVFWGDDRLEDAVQALA